MKRRQFIKRGALFVPMIFIPRAIAFPPSRGPMRTPAAAAAGGGGGGTCPADASPDIAVPDSADDEQIVGQSTDRYQVGQLNFSHGSTVTLCKVGFNGGAN